MKSKNIPADIKIKSIKEAQNEIHDIISYLENGETNLHESIDKYNRMIHLNLHIQGLYEEHKVNIKQRIIKPSGELYEKDKENIWLHNRRVGQTKENDHRGIYEMDWS